MGLFCIILVLRTLPPYYVVCQDIYVNCTQNFDLTPSSSFYLKVERNFILSKKKGLSRANYTLKNHLLLVLFQINLKSIFHLHSHMTLTKIKTNEIDLSCITIINYFYPLDADKSYTHSRQIDPYM